MLLVFLRISMYRFRRIEDPLQIVGPTCGRIRPAPSVFVVFPENTAPCVAMVAEDGGELLWELDLKELWMEETMLIGMEAS